MALITLADPTPAHPHPLQTVPPTSADSTPMSDSSNTPPSPPSSSPPSPDLIEVNSVFSASLRTHNGMLVTLAPLGEKEWNHHHTTTYTHIHEQSQSQSHTVTVTPTSTTLTPMSQPVTPMTPLSSLSPITPPTPITPLQAASTISVNNSPSLSFADGPSILSSSTSTPSDDLSSQPLTRKRKSLDDDDDQEYLGARPSTTGALRIILPRPSAIRTATITARTEGTDTTDTTQNMDISPTNSPIATDAASTPPPPMAAPSPVSTRTTRSSSRGQHVALPMDAPILPTPSQSQSPSPCTHSIRSSPRTSRTNSGLRISTESINHMKPSAPLSPVATRSAGRTRTVMYTPTHKSTPKITATTPATPSQAPILSPIPTTATATATATPVTTPATPAPSTPNHIVTRSSSAASTPATPTIPSPPVTPVSIPSKSPRVTRTSSQSSPTWSHASTPKTPKHVSEDGFVLPFALPATFRAEAWAHQHNIVVPSFRIVTPFADALKPTISTTSTSTFTSTSTSTSSTSTSTSPSAAVISSSSAATSTESTSTTTSPSLTIDTKSPAKSRSSTPTTLSPRLTRSKRKSASTSTTPSPPSSPAITTTPSHPPPDDPSYEDLSDIHFYLRHSRCLHQLKAEYIHAEERRIERMKASKKGGAGYGNKKHGKKPTSPLQIPIPIPTTPGGTPTLISTSSNENPTSPVEHGDSPTPSTPCDSPTASPLSLASSPPPSGSEMSPTQLYLDTNDVMSDDGKLTQPSTPASTSCSPASTPTSTSMPMPAPQKKRRPTPIDRFRQYTPADIAYFTAPWQPPQTIPADITAPRIFNYDHRIISGRPWKRPRIYIQCLSDHVPPFLYSGQPVASHATSIYQYWYDINKSNIQDIKHQHETEDDIPVTTAVSTTTTATSTATTTTTTTTAATSSPPTSSVDIKIENETSLLPPDHKEHVSSALQLKLAEIKKLLQLKKQINGSDTTTTTTTSTSTST